jgi:hypothetical protein
MRKCEVEYSLQQFFSYQIKYLCVNLCEYFEADYANKLCLRIYQKMQI